ncbi:MULTISPECIES: peptidylprolyl isomerase [Eubacteriales]|uniref:Peptidyl-prolyl cis-trans isomerase n=1 Tax=Bittarella massiliensis (ex Durand et al. 2017) TaxID=1720313 RepID=A0AAQ1RW77_9FIRM|nr:MULTISPECIES: peptidylprolyl isomerase [Eubacteriales]ERI97274.1 peptidyl-prolyl cis-trans isomerase, cyclophilin-type [Clostridium sp. ATCC 29733]MZL69206.1 peptidylprolyl isomerase [Bittarella massiliensis (ex Durand et al. 2017)]MZL79787.1 peptidylprolyl isomerase [Bittarella massiliensis (ex Durand et al. 2017)]SHG14870.1 peptidyl-prolyl cis-trans isomerase B (cyclophilin B) [Bittarella massiliensis (ex Durand et al. 2017)]
MNSKIWSVPLALALACSLLLAGCGTDKKESGSKMPMQFQTPAQDAPVAVMHTNQGDISLVLFPEKAPKACENFLTHAKDGYYDGVIFHRVIEGFMIQGGDPEGTGRGGQSIWGRVFENEVSGDLRHFVGALSMANAGPNTNGSQFFIVTGDKVDPSLLKQMEQLGWPQEIIKAYREKGGSPHLDGGYSIFGQVIAGQEVADAISKVETSAGDKPKEDVVIQSIDVTTYGEWAQ